MSIIVYGTSVEFLIVLRTGIDSLIPLRSYATDQTLSETWTLTTKTSEQQDKSEKKLLRGLIGPAEEGGGPVALRK